MQSTSPPRSRWETLWSQVCVVTSPTGSRTDVRPILLIGDQSSLLARAEVRLHNTASRRPATGRTKKGDGIGGEERSRPERCANTKISTKSLNGKLIWPCEENNCLSKDFSKLRQMWRLSSGKREIRYCSFMRSIRSSSPNDYSYIKQVDGEIWLREKKLACMENWK